MNQKYMIEALDLAKKAEKHDEVPVGAVIVMGDKIIAKAYNKREKKRDATAHAEVLAIRKACKKLHDFRLVGCDIYVTLEPCVMCMGAILNARLDNLYFGAKVNKQDVLPCETLASKAGLNHNINITGGIMADECGELVSSYFASKRNKIK